MDRLQQNELHIAFKGKHHLSKVYLPAKTWQNKKVSSAQYTDNFHMPDSPPSCWECLACQVTHGELQPKSTLWLVKMKQAPYWKKKLCTATAVALSSAIAQSPGAWQRPALNSRYLCNRDLCNPKERGTAALWQSILRVPSLGSSIPK